MGESRGKSHSRHRRAADGRRSRDRKEGTVGTLDGSRRGLYLKTLKKCGSEAGLSAHSEGGRKPEDRGGLNEGTKGDLKVNL